MVLSLSLSLSLSSSFLPPSRSPIMSTLSPSYICRNGLAIAYIVLKTKLDRFLDNTHISPLEDFYEKVGRANNLATNQYTLNNSEVEQFYTDQISETNFVATAESRLVRAAVSPAGSPVSLLNLCSLGNGTTVSTGQPGLTLPEVKLLTVIWDMYSMISDISPVASKIPRVCGMCLWQIFLCLDKGTNQFLENVYIQGSAHTGGPNHHSQGTNQGFC